MNQDHEEKQPTEPESPIGMKTAEVPTTRPRETVREAVRALVERLSAGFLPDDPGAR